MRPNALMLSVLLAAPAGAQSVVEDPYLWLEGVEDAKALDWVRGENAKTQAELTGTAEFAALRDDLRAILP